MIESGAAKIRVGRRLYSEFVIRQSTILRIDYDGGSKLTFHLGQYWRTENIDVRVGVTCQSAALIDNLGNASSLFSRHHQWQTFRAFKHGVESGAPRLPGCQDSPYSFLGTW